MGPNCRVSIHTRDRDYSQTLGDTLVIHIRDRFVIDFDSLLRQSTMSDIIYEYAYVYVKNNIYLWQDVRQSLIDTFGRFDCYRTPSRL